MKGQGIQRLLWTSILVTAIVCVGFFYILLGGPNFNARAWIFQQQYQSAFAQSDNDASVNEAGVTGGRARGGSFSAPSRSARARPTGQSPSLSPSRGYSDYGGIPRSSYRRNYYPTPVPGPVVIPFPAPPPTVYVPTPGVPIPTASPAIDLGFIFVLLVLGFAVLPIIVNAIKLGAVGGGSDSAQAGSTEELYNDIVTVTELQVALLAEARFIQRNLARLTAEADLANQQDVVELLRATVVELLRSPEYWAYSLSRSQTFKNREAASQAFEQISVEERSKFQVETLVNVGGQVSRKASPAYTSQEPTSYIVVTLLLGTADDYPLIGTIRSVDDLRAALRRLAAVSPDYLLIYELLWTPQDEADSLTADEVIALYPALARL